MAEHDYTLEVTTGQWEVHISPSTQYGYFENVLTGAGGGLWFESKTLVDYDGIFELPKSVIKSIRILGYHISKEYRT